MKISNYIKRILRYINKKLFRVRSEKSDNGYICMKNCIVFFYLLNDNKNITIKLMDIYAKAIYRKYSDLIKSGTRVNVENVDKILNIK